jgi:hypothetical protein
LTEAFDAIASVSLNFLHTTERWEAGLTPCITSKRLSIKVDFISMFFLKREGIDLKYP